MSETLFNIIYFHPRHTVHIVTVQVCRRQIVVDNVFFIKSSFINSTEDFSHFQLFLYSFRLPTVPNQSANIFTVVGNPLFPNGALLSDYMGL